MRYLATLLISLAVLFAGCDCAVAQDSISDGLNLDNVDAVVRIRNRSGSGTGSCVAETDGSYVFITNHHVAGRKNSRNTLDVWNNGRLVQNVAASVEQSFFSERQSKDIALIRVKKDQFKGPLPVIQLAKYGNDEKLTVGDEIWQVGCDSGNWPNAERGKIVKFENGLIYYLPDSISGNSGGPIYNASGSAQIGVTAWNTTMIINGRSMTVGLAMSSDRVRDIIAGRVSSYPTELPGAATPIQPGPYLTDEQTKKTIALPKAAQQLGVADCPKGQCQPIPTQIRAVASINLQEDDWRLPGSSDDGRKPPGNPIAGPVEDPPVQDDKAGLINEMRQQAKKMKLQAQQQAKEAQQTEALIDRFEKNLDILSQSMDRFK